jgi:regulator of replication initiation timing
MFRSSIEKKLTSVSRELKTLKDELQVLGEQYIQVSDEAEDSRLRSLVSETPLAAEEQRETAKAVAAVRRDRESKLKRLHKLEQRQDALLDQLTEVR